MRGSDEEYVAKFKILIIGQSSVGKSSVLLRFTDDEFSSEVPSTIGVDFKAKVVEVDGLKVKLCLWDTAGTEKFRALTPGFYRGAQAAILVYDVTCSDSLQKLNYWLDELDAYKTKENIVTLVLGNKIDKPDRVVSREEGMRFAQKHKTLFLESSAKTTDGVAVAFEEVVRKIIQTPGLWEATSDTHQLGQGQQQELPYNTCSYCSYI